MLHTKNGLTYVVQKITDDVYQIIGEVNGFGVRHRYDEGIKLDYTFFIRSKQIKRKTNQKDNSLTNLDDIYKSIDEAIEHEMEIYVNGTKWNN